MHLRRLALALLFSLFTLPPSLFAANRAADWRAVADAQKAGQPKTASAALDSIITSAIGDKAYPEALRAILIKAQADASVENRLNQAAAQIRTLTTWLADDHAPALPASMRPLLEAALAKQWWSYYQANRWQLLQRTQTSEQPSDDFLTWDARRVLAETASHFEAALSDPVTLQKTPIAKLEPLLAKGELPDTYRPTLYDFLVHEAIAFYSAGEQGVSKSEDAFEPAPDSPILGTLEEFLAWNPGSAEPKPGSIVSQNQQPENTTDVSPVPRNPTIRAIQLYQQLLRFHLDDPLPQLALADAERHRITWAINLLGNQATPYVESTFRAFIKRWEKNPVAVAACLGLAGHFQEKDNLVAARAVALEGVKLDSKAPAANHCLNLVAEIESPELEHIATEYTWAEPWHGIRVRYRNQDKIHFRAIALDWKDMITGKIPEPDEPEFKLSSRKPALAWTASLPKTTDYRFRNENIPAPRKLKPGLYLIAASLKKNFSDKNNRIDAAVVWVSDLAIVINSSNNGAVSGFVVNATSGEPVSKTTVSVWRDDDTTPVCSTTTSSDGSFIFNPPLATRIHLVAQAKNGHAIATFQDGIYVSPPANNPPKASSTDYVYFFTDRSIYRPGQSIQFKVIALRLTNDGETKTLLKNRELSILLVDPNGKTAGHMKPHTNGFGSANGSFTLPAGLLPGAYTIRSIGTEMGNTSISVEEYKRPKFEASIEAPEIAAKLEDTVTLAGAATSYTSAPIDGAKVSWRVRRIVRWPRWCWWFVPPSTNNQEIAHGVATTDHFGKFTIQFTALADKSVDPKNEPIFDYAISAEITDGTGETRDASRIISVGYTALAADITTDTWLTTEKAIPFAIKTTSLDGIAQSSKGRISIHPLEQPENITQPEIPGYHYSWFARISTSIEKTALPASDIRGWPEKPAIEKKSFVTDAKTGLAEIKVNLPAGIYRAILTTHDRFGKTITARTEFRVIDPEATQHNIKEAFFLAAPKWEANLGDTFTALWASGYETARAYISIEQKDTVIKAFWTDEGATSQKITLPITKAMQGGATLRIFQYRDNRLITRNQNIAVPLDSTSLKISWEHFNSKLISGGRETWTAKITAPNNMQTAAEMAATLYDVSLDQFRPHNWPETLTAQGSYKYTRNRFTSRTNTIANFEEIDDTLDGPETLSATPLTYWRWRHEMRFHSDIVVLDKFAVTEDRSGSARANTFMQQSADDGFVRVGGLDPKYAGFSMDGFTLASAGNFQKAVRSTDQFGSATDERQSVRPTPDQTALTKESQPDLTAVTARKNLNETAFFFPQLLTDSDGSVRMEFTVPEALTRWKFLGFAHDKQLRSAILTDTAVTAKDLMVQPNPPRFLREGDTVEFTVKITNMTDKPQTGSAQLSFADASSLEAVNLFTGSTINSEQKPVNFSLGANSSQTLSWRITIPDGQGFLTYKAVASTGAVSDGEEGFLPVLSRRQLVTESITLPVRDKGTYTFRFPKLAESETSALQSFSPSPRIPNRANDQQPRLVCRARAAQPHGIPARMHRATLQPLLRQRPRRAHCQLRPENRARLRAMAQHPRARIAPPQKRGPQIRAHRGNPVAARRHARK
ncbi:alpha-2-macroglobulin family protein [Ereboglobus luteus]|uniref:alpha-2-macroglobulin family protein n=1 Tax=Ereboglobus luteus TaxID=1796921 RepID=UPI00192D5760|nr:alpha-2-macroglobulin family protein [Ereboglobus luteus]